MAATRERLEAEIRAQLTLLSSGHMLFGTPATEMMNRITENILDAADEYTYAELGLLTPAERRHILFEGTS
jgi:hypothetical protein